MLFNSFHFVVFFVIVIALNQSLRRWPGAQKLMLLAASYYFYGQWNWLYLLLILFSTITDYAIGLGLVKVRRPRQLLIISLIVNLGVLFFFKYVNWAIGNWNDVDSMLGTGLTLSPLDLLLPVGISFYTFQSMSYTIDVYRGDSPPRRNFLDYSLFIAFFPQLVAGPIVRDGEFFHELDRDREIDFATVRQALVLIALGYVKKVAIADNLAAIVEPVFDATVAQGFWDTLLAIYAFSMQIYCDFSGYTDIAIGCALLLGFRFPKNFNYPYVAESIQDFWRRWHMTLSRWLRDYLYISLGGNRKGPSRTHHQPDADHAARRPVARRKLELRDLGWLAWPLSGRRTRRAQALAGMEHEHPRRALAAHLHHLPSGLLRLDLLPRTRSCRSRADPQRPRPFHPCRFQCRSSSDPVPRARWIALGAVSRQ